MRPFLIGCALVALSAVTLHARAEEPALTREAARALADEGADAFARGDYELAHERLSRAFSVVPAPTIAVLDARALAMLGRFTEAESAYKRALATPVDEASPAAFHEAIANARTELAALEPPPPPAPPAPPPRARPDSTSTLAVLAFSVGGAGVLTGAIAGGFALSKRNDAVRDCPARRCPAGSAGAEAVHDFRTYRTISAIGYGVGLAGAAFGTVTLLARSEPGDAEVGVAPVLAGVSVRGSF